MRKIIIIVLTSCTVLLLLGFIGHRGYLVWKERKWLGMAREFVAKEDNRSAYLSLQQVLRVNSQNVEACRLMAEIAEASRSAGALVWRQRVVELQPNATEERLALAKTALIFQDYALATNTLAGVSAPDKKTYAYLNLAGNAAIATGQPELAAANFREAARVEPWNSIPELNLAVLKLQGTNTTELAEARMALQRVSQTSTNLDLRCLALRALVSDAARFEQMSDALKFSEELLIQPESNFRDRILRLEVIRAAKPGDFDKTLASFQREAGTNGNMIYELARWQIARLGPASALTWLRRLPPAVQTNQPTTMILADCFTLEQDWTALQQALEKQNWAELEFLRHAFLARALRGNSFEAAAKASWTQALNAASNQKGRLTLLLQFAARATWLSEAEEILWKIVNLYPDDQTAVFALSQGLYLNGRTRPLLNLLVLQAKRKPTDLSIKNNLAMTALLLNAQELKPHDLARQVYQQAPTNSAYASTYAFSLYAQNQTTEALKILRQLPPKELESPGVAGYYGLVLKANGDKIMAAHYLDRALKSLHLPEEKRLFESARAEL